MAVADPHRQAYRRTVVAASFGLLATASVLLVPSLRFAYRSGEGRLVLETVAAMTAALVALLLYGRFRRTGSIQALVLAYAMSLLAVAGAGFTVLPQLLGSPSGSAITTWGQLVVRLVGAVLLVVAAFSHGRTARSPASVTRDALVVASLLTGVAVAMQLLAFVLPSAVETSAVAEASGLPSFDAHLLVLVTQATVLVCDAVAAVAFTRQAARTADPLAGWIGAACALGAAARVAYLLFPSLYSDWLYTGDLLRLGFYLLLLVGAVREVQAYWEAQAEAAVFEERRRLARELHDGAVQEIGFIHGQAERLAAVDGVAPQARQISAAAERALDETRRAVAALAAPPDESLAEGLARAVREVADRAGVAVHCDLDGGVDAPPDVREALIRIAREAVSNAGRHSGASSVSVRLKGRQLEVADDGCGFDVDGAGGGPGYGLVSMRDRAEGIEGALAISSKPGRGTAVHVAW